MASFFAARVARVDQDLDRQAFDCYSSWKLSVVVSLDLLKPSTTKAANSK